MATTTTVAWYDLIPEVPELPEDALQQDDTIMHLFSVLTARYSDNAYVLVSGQTNVIYNSAVPGSFVSPDCYVVFGVDVDLIRRERRSYRIDEWGVAPAFVAEVASASTAGRDLGDKRRIYARMGAQEYWRFDKAGEHYGEPLAGERLIDGEYQPCERYEDETGVVWQRSEALGVDFCWGLDEQGHTGFQMRDTATGRWLNTLAEAERRIEAERDARQAAEARVAELEAKIRRLRGE